MNRVNRLPLMISIMILSLLVAACTVNIDLGNSEPQPPQNAEPTIQMPADITASTEPPSSWAPGSIRGKLSYPSEFIPPLRVVTFRLENGSPTQEFVYVDSVLNDGVYQIDGLQPGEYWIVAYTIPGNEGIPVGLAGGYSQFVPCGLSVECNDHSLIPVMVNSRQVTEGVDPADWYAPDGSFPTIPVQ